MASAMVATVEPVVLEVPAAAAVGETRRLSSSTRAPVAGARQAVPGGLEGWAAMRVAPAVRTGRVVPAAQVVPAGTAGREAWRSPHRVPAVPVVSEAPVVLAEPAVLAVVRGSIKALAGRVVQPEQAAGAD